MNIAFYSGVSGLVAFQQDLDVLAHNMANVNTMGYKATRTAFSDLLYSEMAVNNGEKPLVGHGVKARATELLMDQGNMYGTINDLDFAIMGEGFFAIDRGGDQIQYTRNGAFDISLEGDKAYLVSSDDGGYVLSPEGKPVELTRIPNTKTYDTMHVGVKIGIFDFDNPEGLQQIKGTSFLETETSGEARVVNNTNEREAVYKLMNHALEASSVVLAQQMVDVIMTQKAFQFSAKMVQTSDQMEEIINNLR